MNKKVLLFPITFLLLIPIVKSQPIREVNTTILGIKRTDSGAEGALANLVVQLRKGEGKVFVSSMPLTKVDTQASARLAKETACGILNKNCSRYDFAYIIRSSSPIIGGPSAGSSMAVATLALLTNKTLNNSVMISGTVNPDGSVGPVGGLLEKTRAAFRGGAKYVLIPEGQKIIKTTKTERERTGPIVTEATVTEEIDLQSYAQKHWGIEVKEVSDIREAYNYFTGYGIELPSGGEKVKTAEFEEVLKQMFLSMYNKTKLNFEELKQGKKKYALSLSMENRIDQLIDQIEKDMDSIRDLQNKEKYYSGASKALETNVKIRYGLNLIEYVQAESKKVYVNKKVEEISSELRGVESEITGGRKVQSRNEIEVLTTAIDRLRQAETLLDEANRNYYNKKYQEAVYDFSFAKERLNTVQEWISVSKQFEGDLNKTFKTSNLKDLARERISEAQSKEVYVSTLGIKPGEASTHLERAEEAYKTEDYVYSIFESLKSIAISNLRMEIRGIKEENLDSRIQEKKERVKAKIKEAKQRGVLPILSTSYLEFSEDKKDKLTSLVYLEYSNQFINLADNILNSLGGKEIQKPEAKVKEWGGPERAPSFEKILGSSIISLVGFCVGLISGVFIEKRYGKQGE